MTWIDVQLSKAATTPKAPAKRPTAETRLSKLVAEIAVQKGSLVTSIVTRECCWCKAAAPPCAGSSSERLVCRGIGLAHPIVLGTTVRMRAKDAILWSEFEACWEAKTHRELEEERRATQREATASRYRVEPRRLPYGCVGSQLAQHSSECRKRGKSGWERLGQALRRGLAMWLRGLHKGMARRGWVGFVRLLIRRDHIDHNASSDTVHPDLPLGHSCVCRTLS